MYITVSGRPRRPGARSAAGGRSGPVSAIVRGPVSRPCAATGATARDHGRPGSKPARSFPLAGAASRLAAPRAPDGSPGRARVPRPGPGFAGHPPPGGRTSRGRGRSVAMKLGAGRAGGTCAE